MLPKEDESLAFDLFLLVNLFAVTEGSSEFSDGDLDMSRRRSRRSQKAQVNYRETSESDGSQAGTNRSRVKARRRRQSSDSEGQHTLQQGAPGSESFTDAWRQLLPRPRLVCRTTDGHQGVLCSASSSRPVTVSVAS